MELFKIVDASESLIKLSRQDLPIRNAFKLQVLIDIIRDYTQNFSVQQAKLLNTYGIAVKNKPGAYTIPLKNTEKYNSELGSLLNTEVVILTDKIEIIMTDTLIFSAADIACTLPFINYTDGSV